MKWFLSTIALLGTLSCQAPWKGDDLKGSVMLDRTAPVEGRHCESSALRNALLYQGYDFEEFHIPGGGGAMGFLYQKGKFPFLGGRSLTMVPVFMEAAGIEWHSVENPVPEDSWRDIASLLQNDIPVVLRVDMRYLPYLYGGKAGPRYMSFGWHVITLYGVDWDRSVAWVSDTDRSGLQEIALKDLHRARYSDCEFLPPTGNYYWVEKASAEYRADWQDFLDTSIREWVGNYEATMESENAMGGLEGLKRLPDEIRSMENDIPATLLPMVLNSMYGWIETNGTGGASFRQFTLEYLEDMYRRTEDNRLVQAIVLMETSVDQWHRLSAAFKTAAADKAGLRQNESRRRHLELIAAEAEELYKREEEFYLYLKETFNS